MTFSQARRELARRVAQAGSQKEVIAKIGCTKSHLSQVLSGKKSFGPDYIFAIEKHFGIPASAWNNRRTA